MGHRDIPAGGIPEVFYYVADSRALYRYDSEQDQSTEIETNFTSLQWSAIPYSSSQACF